MMRMTMILIHHLLLPSPPLFLPLSDYIGDIAFRLMNRAIEGVGVPQYRHDPPAITVCDINAEMLKVGKERAKHMFTDPM